MSKRILLALASVGVTTIASAKPVTSLADLTSTRSMLTVTFTEQRFADNHSLADIGQPLESLGLLLPNQILTSNSIDGLSRGEAIRSSQIDETTNSNIQSINFIYAQKEVGFTILDKLATKITVTAYDRAGGELEHTALDASAKARFVGFSRDKAEITRIVVSAKHNTLTDATSSPTIIDDITFAAPVFERTTMLDGGSGSQQILGLEDGGYLHSGGESNLLASADMPDISPSGGVSQRTSGSLHGNTFQPAPGSIPPSELFATPSDVTTPAPNLVVDPGVTTSTVPEPGSVALTAILILPALLRRKRAQSN